MERVNAAAEKEAKRQAIFHQQVGLFIGVLGGLSATILVLLLGDRQSILELAATQRNGILYAPYLSKWIGSLFAPDIFFDGIILCFSLSSIFSVFSGLGFCFTGAKVVTPLGKLGNILLFTSMVGMILFLLPLAFLIGIYSYADGGIVLVAIIVLFAIIFRLIVKSG